MLQDAWISDMPNIASRLAFQDHRPFGELPERSAVLVAEVEAGMNPY
jgi:hypothetical protein